jgi:hypothetical protein
MDAAIINLAIYLTATFAAALVTGVAGFSQGKLRKEIARTLGVSVMTLHRWRKALLGVHAAIVAPPDTGQPDSTRGADDQVAELRLENLRLRRLVTDLLLGKIKLEEAAQSQTIRRVKGRDEYSDMIRSSRVPDLWTHSIMHVRYTPVARGVVRGDRLAQAIHSRCDDDERRRKARVCTHSWG